MLIADKIRIEYLQDFGVSSTWDFQFIECICKQETLTNKQILKLREIYEKIRCGAYTTLYYTPSRYYHEVFEENSFNYSYDEIHDFDR
jgi:hypothetical protein